MQNVKKLWRAPSASAVIALAVCLASPFSNTAARGADIDRTLPSPLLDQAPKNTGPETLILAGGCFWGVQGVFQHVRGVVNAVSGYDGGAANTAQYEVVSTGTTGHAESVRITYDPHVVTYGHLLQIFFSVATDPTQLNEQYPDEGTQYRSEIFATTPEQVQIVKGYIAQLDQARVFSGPIVTQVTPLKGFYRAEDYHQDYALNHPENPYILVCDRPKIAALKQQFPELFTEYKGH